MSRKCCVPECKSEDIRRYRLPSNPEICQEWIRRIGSPEPGGKVYFVCGRHFDEKCIISKTGKLYKISLPTLNLPYYHGPENDIFFKFSTEEPKAYTFPDEISKAIKHIQKSQEENKSPYQLLVPPRLCRFSAPKKTYSKKEDATSGNDLRTEQAVSNEDCQPSSTSSAEPSELISANTSELFGLNPSPFVDDLISIPQKITPNKNASQKHTVKKKALIRIRSQDNSKKSQSPNTNNTNNTPSAGDYHPPPVHERLHDDSAIYGYHVASKHRKYSQHTRSVVEHLIGNILYKADFGFFEQHNPYRSCSPSNRMGHSNNFPQPSSTNNDVVDVYEEHQSREQLVVHKPEYDLVIDEPKSSPK